MSRPNQTPPSTRRSNAIHPGDDYFTTRRSAGDLPHELPAKLQSFDPSIGRVHVLYPHADADRCTAGLLLAADAVGFVRGESPDRGFLLGRSSNDRPSAAPSFPGRGFAGDGRANTVGVFDPKALAPVAAVATGKNPDAVPYDPATKRVFAFDGATATAIGGVTAESRRVRGGRTTAAR